MSLGWDKDHSIARGLIVGFSDHDYEFLTRNQSRFDDIQHSLQIPLLLIEAILKRDCNDLRIWDQSLVGVGTIMTLEGLGSSEVLSSIDFDDLIRRLTLAMSRLAFLRMRINGLSFIMERIRKLAQRIEAGGTTPQDSFPPELEKSLTMLCKEAESLASIVEYQQQHSQVLSDLVGRVSITYKVILLMLIKGLHHAPRTRQQDKPKTGNGFNGIGRSSQSR